MGTVRLEAAHDSLRALVEQAEAGEVVELTRGEVPVARIVLAQPRRRIDAMLFAPLADLPVAEQSAADLVRTMRDSDRF